MTLKELNKTFHSVCTVSIDFSFHYLCFKIVASCCRFVMSQLIDVKLEDIGSEEDPDVYVSTTASYYMFGLNDVTCYSNIKTLVHDSVLSEDYMLAQFIDIDSMGHSHMLKSVINPLSVNFNDIEPGKCSCIPRFT